MGLILAPFGGAIFMAGIMLDIHTGPWPDGPLKTRTAVATLWALGLGTMMLTWALL